MSRHVFAVVLLAVLGAVLLVLMRPRVAHAQPGSCSIPKSAGSYRGGLAELLVFESASGTLSIYISDCSLVRTVTRN